MYKTRISMPTYSVIKKEESKNRNVKSESYFQERKDSHNWTPHECWERCSNFSTYCAPCQYGPENFDAFKPAERTKNTCPQSNVDGLVSATSGNPLLDRGNQAKSSNLTSTHLSLFVDFSRLFAKLFIYAAGSANQPRFLKVDHRK